MNTVNINTISNNQLWTIEDLIPKEECSELIKYAEEQGFKTITETIKENKLTAESLEDYRNLKDVQIRTSYMCEKFDSQFSTKIFNKIKNLFPDELSDGRKKVKCDEVLRILKYKKGDFFRPHLDGSYDERDENMKKILGSCYTMYTILIYLNDDYEGGETKFYNILKEGNHIKIEKKTGKSTIFNINSTVHSGTEITSGVKYVLRTGIMYTAKAKDGKKILPSIQVDCPDGKQPPVPIE
eukprot:gene6756-10921_t